MDYEDHDLSYPIKASNVLECQQKCKEHQYCNFFTYSKSTKNCHLKTAKKIGPKNNDLISGPAVCCFVHKVDYWGNDIRQVQTSTDVECQKACQNEPKCEYWTLVLSLQKCHLKSAKEIGSTNNPDLISGPKTCPGMQYFLIKNSKSSKIFIQIPLCAMLIR